MGNIDDEDEDTRTGVDFSEPETAAKGDDLDDGEVDDLDADEEDDGDGEAVAVSAEDGAEPPEVSRKIRRRRRRTRPRSKTIAMKRLTREELRVGALLYPPVEVRGLLKLKMSSPTPDELGAGLINGAIPDGVN